VNFLNLVFTAKTVPIAAAVIAAAAMMILRIMLHLQKFYGAACGIGGVQPPK
jgi:hypothetical protein